MKVYFIKPMLTEQVRLNLKTRTIDNKNGVLCEVTWYSNGDYEIHPLKSTKVGQVHKLNRIPFSPINHSNFPEYKWGDRE